MAIQLLLAVFLVAIPLVYLGHRLGFWASSEGGRSRAGRLILAALAVGAVLFHLPFEGVGADELHRLNLLLAAAVVAWLLARRYHLAGADQDRVFDLGLAVLAAFSLLVYFNFFALHGKRTWIHYHDVAHYHLGTEYFDELSYPHLYTAMLRAEAEVYDNRFKTLEARDLATNELVDIVSLLQRSDPVKAAFSPERWEDFKQDVAFYRERMGPLYKDVLLDQGFNAPPFWALVGRTAASTVPPGSATGIFAWTLVDPLLLLISFAAIAWAFGRRAALLSILLFCLAYGAFFDWTGGAFLRYLWFFGVVVGLCCVHRERPIAAGVLLAFATLLRIFPAFFVVGLAAQGAWELWRTRRVPRFHGRFGAAFVLAGVVFFASTAWLEDGLSTWQDFHENSQLYVGTISPNIVGMTAALAFEERPSQVTRDEFQAIEERRNRIYRVQRWTLFVAGLAALILVAPGLSPTQAFVMGYLPIFLGLNLACYYSVVLVLLVLARRGDLSHLLLIFGGEAVVYVFELFEPSDGMLYIYRSLVVLYVLLAIYAGPIAQAARRVLVRSPSG